MPRLLQTDRLRQLIDAAIEVFTAKGYRRTQMSDIARLAGVSQGTLYNYVESKEALFHLIADHGFTDAPLPDATALPIRTPSRDATINLIRDRIRTTMGLPELDRALNSKPATIDPRAELESIIRELFVMMESTRRAADLVERSALDLPELAELFFGQARMGLIDRIARYLRSRIAAGALRPLPDIPAAARLILETVVWFARHRHHPTNSSNISDEAALETTVDILVNGLLAQREQGESKREKGRRTT